MRIGHQETIAQVEYIHCKELTVKLSNVIILAYREAFERNSRAVELTPEHVPDINVITGVLKDYLRELPEPLFTKCLFQMTVDALGSSVVQGRVGELTRGFRLFRCLPAR